MYYNKSIIDGLPLEQAWFWNSIDEFVAHLITPQWALKILWNSLSLGFLISGKKNNFHFKSTIFYEIRKKGRDFRIP